MTMKWCLCLVGVNVGCSNMQGRVLMIVVTVDGGGFGMVTAMDAGGNVLVHR